MATPINWHGANTILNPPRGSENISQINAFNNGKCSVSCWQLSAEEMIDLINNNGRIFVGVLGGKSQYPMFVGSEDFCRSVVIDTGPVWNKNKDLDNKIPK